MYKIVCRIKDNLYNINREHIIDSITLSNEREIVKSYYQIVSTAIMSSSRINHTEFPTIRIKPFDIVTSELSMSTEVEIARFYDDAHDIEHSLWLLIDKK